MSRRVQAQDILRSLSGIASRATLLFCVALALSACGKLSALPNFKGKLIAGAGPTVSLTSVSFSSPFVIDADSASVESWEVNNDVSVSCTNLIGGAATSGCMQPPAVLFSDSRWFVGFSQNYLSSVLGNFFSLFAALSTPSSGVFQGLGQGLGLIDSGGGINPASTSWSSRYVRFAKFTNGDVIAVYQNELSGPGTARVTYATIYSAATHTWGATRQLGDSGNNSQTDQGSDYAITAVNRMTHLCRPTVATAGDGSALVAWCEESTGGAVGNAEIKYARYKNGAWINAAGTPSELVASTSTLVYPGFSGSSVDFSAVIGGIASGDIVSSSIAISTGTGSTLTGLDVATVKAVDSSPGAGMFKIERDPVTSSVLPCSTLSNMITSLLAKPVYNYNIADSQLTRTLSQDGVSYIRNPACSDSDSTTWTISMYFNRGLNGRFRDTAGTDNAVGGIARAPAATPTMFTAVAASAITMPSNFWYRSGLVDVAGDSSGNYSLVRSAVSPHFLYNDISNTGFGQARALVGHQFNAATGWKTQAKDSSGLAANASTLLLSTSQISGTPTCYSGIGTEASASGYDYIACSARSPKLLMSSTGLGLALYYKNQSFNYYSNLSGGTPTNPTRLWVNVLSSGSGFSATSSVLDLDVTCSPTSVGNDASICEASDYTVAGKCLTLGEPSTLTAIAQRNGAALGREVTPIAAAMNSTGQAVIAYHKSVSTGSSSLPSCGSIGTYVVTYDPLSGFADTVQIDGQSTYDTGHAAAAVSENGKVAVVWEQIIETTTPTVYLYVAAKINGVWSSPTLVNTSHTEPNSQMMPSVGINDSGEVIVTYSYATGAGIRRQYVKHLFYK